jgi:hypothetical protein
VRLVTLVHNANFTTALESHQMIQMFVILEDHAEVPKSVLVTKGTLEINVKLLFVMERLILLLVLVQMGLAFLQIYVHVRIMVAVNANSQNALEYLEMNPMSAVHTEHAHSQIIACAFQLTEEVHVKNQSVMDLIQVKHCWFALEMELVCLQIIAIAQMDILETNARFILAQIYYQIILMFVVHMETVLEKINAHVLMVTQDQIANSTFVLGNLQTTQMFVVVKENASIQTVVHVKVVGKICNVNPLPVRM